MNILYVLPVAVMCNAGLFKLLPCLFGEILFQCVIISVNLAEDPPFFRDSSLYRYIYYLTGGVQLNFLEKLFPDFGLNAYAAMTSELACRRRPDGFTDRDPMYSGLDRISAERVVRACRHNGYNLFFLHTIFFCREGGTYPIGSFSFAIILNFSVGVFQLVLAM